MARVKGGVIHKNRRKKVLKQAEGYFGSKHRLYHSAKEQVMHSLRYAYRDRRRKKRDFRKLWITRINAACLSQCSNFLIFKMLHPRDVDYIREMVPNITNEIVKRLRILQPGTCIAFGNAFKVPVLVQFAMPDPAPSSSNCDISGIWFVNKK